MKKYFQLILSITMISTLQPSINGAQRRAKGAKRAQLRQQIFPAFQERNSALLESLATQLGGSDAIMARNYISSLQKAKPKKRANSKKQLAKVIPTQDPTSSLVHSMEEKDKEEESPRPILAVSNAKNIFTLLAVKGVLEEYEHSIEEPDIRSLYFHSGGLCLSGLKDSTITSLGSTERGFVRDGEYPLPQEVVDSIAYHPSNKFLASSSHVRGDFPQYTILVYNLVDDERLPFFQATNKEEGIVTLAYDPTGTFLAATNNVKNTVTMLCSNRTAHIGSSQKLHFCSHPA